MKLKDLLKKRVRGLAPSWGHNLVRKLCFLHFWWKNCGFGGFSGDVVARSVLEQPITFSRHRNRYPQIKYKKRTMS